MALFSSSWISVITDFFVTFDGTEKTNTLKFPTALCSTPLGMKTYLPGTQIPILDEEELFIQQPEYALLLSWHIGQELIPKLRAKG